MTLSINDRRCTVNAQPTPQGYTFHYKGKTYRRSTQEGLHSFFLKHTSLDTVKLRLPNEKYYLHFTLDEPERFTTKQALRRVISRESQGAWIEEKNGKQRYFVDKGWFFSDIKEVTKEEFLAHQSSGLLDKVSAFALGSLAVGAKVASFSSGGVVGSALMQSGLVQAQVPIGDEFRVNTNTMGNQQYPRVAVLMNEEFVIVWQGDQTGDWDIYGQAYDANGTNLSGEFRAHTTTASDQQYPDIARLYKGGFSVVWQSGPNPNYDVYGRGYNVSRNPVGVEFLVNTYTTNDQTSPAIEGLMRGDYVIAYQSQRSGSDEIYSQSYSDSHLPIGPETPVNTITSDNQRYPALTDLKDEGFILGWATTTTGQSKTDIFGRRFNASSAALGIEFLLNNKTTSHCCLGLASLSNGGYVATWQDDLLAYNTTGQVFNALNLPVGSEFVIYNTKPTLFLNRIIITLAGLPAGGFIAVWTDVYNDIYGQIFDDVGFRLGPEFRVNTNTTGIQSYPDIAIFQDGSFVVVWMGDQTGNYDIYARKFNISTVLGASSTSFSLFSSLQLTTSFTTSQAPLPSSAQVTSSSGTPTSILPSSSSQSNGRTSMSSLTSQPSPSINTAGSSSAPSTSTSVQETSQMNGISSSSQASSNLLVITSISYGVSNDILLNGVSVGTFTFSGGSGIVDGTQSNTITLVINPDLIGETLNLFNFPPGTEGQFQTIDLVGQSSCQSFESQVVQDGGSQVFQAIFQGTTCALAARSQTLFLKV
jgi:hypothetical protein